MPEENILRKRVPQRDKLKKPLALKPFPWKENHKKFLEIARDNQSQIVLVSGPAGTGKSILAVYAALELLNLKKVSDIIYIRSAVESTEARLGFLPGDVEQKLHFFNMPFYDKLEEILDKPSIELLRKEQRISFHPLGYSRGMSWNAKCIILDEAQNSSIKEIITVLTRLGEKSKCFVLADPMQTDLQNGKRGGFVRTAELFRDAESAGHGIKEVTFTKDDIVRSELVKFLISKFETIQNAIV